MASTIQTAKLTVVHTESWTLNDGTHEDTVNSNNTLEILNVADIYKRTVLVTTDKIEFLAFGTGVGKGTFNEANVKYMRFTNKDNSNHVNLFFTNESSDEFAVKLDKGQSFVFNGDLSGGLVDTFDANTGGAASSGQLADVTKFQAQADSGSVHMEIFVACT